jgi:hypothetical protein
MGISAVVNHTPVQTRNIKEVVKSSSLEIQARSPEFSPSSVRSPALRLLSAAEPSSFIFVPIEQRAVPKHISVADNSINRDAALFRYPDCQFATVPRSVIVSFSLNLNTFHILVARVFDHNIFMISSLAIISRRVLTKY